MGLETAIHQDLVQAMKAKDEIRVSTLRMVKSAIMNYQIEKSKDKLEDQDVISIIQKQAKQRHESVESYEKASRPDLAGKEKAEIAILESYLPKQLSEEELSQLVKDVIEKLGAKSKADIGKVMKEAMARIQGQADGKRVSTMASSLLN